MSQRVSYLQILGFRTYPRKKSLKGDKIPGQIILTADKGRKINQMVNLRSTCWILNG